MFAGAERADSLVVDPHKWLYVPYEAGRSSSGGGKTWCGRSRATARTRNHRRTPTSASGCASKIWGRSCARSFRALKVWATIRSIGLDGYRDLWRKDLAVRREVCRLARRHPRLEVLSEGDLSILSSGTSPPPGIPTPSTGSCSITSTGTAACSWVR